MDSEEAKIWAKMKTKEWSWWWCKILTQCQAHWEQQQNEGSMAEDTVYADNVMEVCPSINSDKTTRLISALQGCSPLGHLCYWAWMCIQFTTPTYFELGVSLSHTSSLLSCPQSSPSHPSSCSTHLPFSFCLLCGLLVVAVYDSIDFTIKLFHCQW